jgi:lipopolysaccharide transport system ATP-binding protein
MGVAPDEIKARCAEIHAFTELDDAFDDPVRTYSSGMAARLYFAAATALRADVYLIDEVLSVGDEHFKAKCWIRMRELLLNGASGVLVTHDWTAVLRLCEEAHVIERGQIAFSGSSPDAVVHYLSLPRLAARAARFAGELPQPLRARTGEDARLRFPVELLEPGPVDFGFSVEMLEPGIGWEILLLEDGIPVAEEPGRYTIEAAIPRLPLPPGRYSLNVFLSRRRRSPGDATIGLDARTWTRGDAWVLEVEGDEARAAVRLPFTARPLAEGGS